MIFIGNTYPFNLIRRPARIAPIAADEARRLLADGFVSYWGHENTLKVASDYAGVDLTPPTQRPALVLDGENLPSYNGVSTGRVLVLSPEYVPGFRPAIGVEVEAGQILGWQWLLVEFESSSR